jgi:hypothetical protein
VALGGPAAFLTYRLVETTRAWKPMPAEMAAPLPSRPLLLADRAEPQAT